MSPNLAIDFPDFIPVAASYVYRRGSCCAPPVLSKKCSYCWQHGRILPLMERLRPSIWAFSGS
jgi:hypothetical protein